MNEKIEALLKQMQESGSSEAIAMADTILNAIACDESDDEIITIALSIADEFIGWGEAIRSLSANHSNYQKN